MKTIHVRVLDARLIQQTPDPFRIPWRAAVAVDAATSQTFLHEVRWRNDGRLHKARRRTRALAEALQSGIRQAAENGEEFDAVTGLPASLRSVCA